MMLLLLGETSHKFLLCWYLDIYAFLHMMFGLWTIYVHCDVAFHIFLYMLLWFGWIDVFSFLLHGVFLFTCSSVEGSIIVDLVLPSVEVLTLFPFWLVIDYFFSILGDNGSTLGDTGRVSHALRRNIIRYWKVSHHSSVKYCMMLVKYHMAILRTIA